MPKITTDLVGGETTATFKTRLNAIVQYWTNTALASGVTYGTQRGIFNGLQGPQITNGEVALSFISKINTMNDIDLAIKAVAFGHGENGFWLDPSDTNTLFQDTARTIPVTAAGQSVAGVSDKSGRGNHFVQSTASRQPTYQINSLLPVIRFDGVDDALERGAGGYTFVTDEVTIAAGIKKNSEAAVGRIFANGTNGTPAGGLTLNAPGAAGQLTASTGSSSTGATVTIGAAPVTCVLVSRAKIAANVNEIWLNGTLGGTNSSAQLASPTYTSANLIVGAQTSGGVNPFNGDIYGILMTDRKMSDPEVVLLSQLMRFKSGAY